MLEGLSRPIPLADPAQRGLIPDVLLNRLLRVESYLQAEFPTGEQLNAVDWAIISAWNISVP